MNFGTRDASGERRLRTARRVVLFEQWPARSGTRDALAPNGQFLHLMVRTEKFPSRQDIRLTKDTENGQIWFRGSIGVEGAEGEMLRRRTLIARDNDSRLSNSAGR